MVICRPSSCNSGVYNSIYLSVVLPHPLARIMGRYMYTCLECLRGRMAVYRERNSEKIMFTNRGSRDNDFRGLSQNPFYLSKLSNYVSRRKDGTNFRPNDHVLNFCKYRQKSQWQVVFMVYANENHSKEFSNQKLLIVCASVFEIMCPGQGRDQNNLNLRTLLK